MFENLFSRTQGRLRSSGTGTLAAARSKDRPVINPRYLTDRLFVHGKAAYVSGLQWTPLEGSKSLFLQRSLAEGQRSYCSTADQSMVGLLLAVPRAPARVRGPVLSVALMFAEALSQGGDEIFAFHVDESRSCFVALRGGMPVPGFDVIGPPEVIIERLVSYLDLPHVDSVRRVGAHDLLGAAAEAIDWDLLANTPVSGARLRAIHDVRKFGMVLIGAALLFGAGAWGVMHKLQADRIAHEAALREAQDPNRVYDDQIDGRLRLVQGTGQAGFDCALAGLRQVPLSVAGWNLSRIDCSPSLCTAYWTRGFGSFADFAAARPASTVGDPEFEPEGGGALPGTRIMTHHQTAAGGSAAAAADHPTPLTRKSLPQKKTLQQSFFSYLQDLTLIDVTVSAESAQLYGADSIDSSQQSTIRKPVVTGRWTITGPLWTLDSLRIEPYQSVENLSIEFADPKNTKVQYKVSGRYYAKGQDY